MKFFLVGLLSLASFSASACYLQDEQSDLVRASKIKCNEITNIATILDPEVEIEGAFFNLTGAYGVKVEYWETDTKRYNSENRERTVVDRKQKTKIESRYISDRFQHEICRPFGFKSSVGVEIAGLFSYFKKAYSFDHHEHAPLSEIKCRS